MAGDAAHGVRLGGLRAGRSGPEEGDAQPEGCYGGAVPQGCEEAVGGGDALQCELEEWIGDWETESHSDDKTLCYLSITGDKDNDK